jgi:hypothetical protein
MKPISGVAIGMWTLVSIIFDVIGIIPGVGDFAGPILMGSLTIYLWRKGYGFVNVKRLAVVGIDTVMEMIPAIQSIPINLVAGTVVILTMAKIQAKTGMPVMGKAGPQKALNVQGVRQSEKAIVKSLQEEKKTPVNSGGTRAPRILDTDETLAA